MVLKITSFLFMVVMVICYKITESNAASLAITEKDSQYASTTISLELDNIITQNNQNGEIVINDNKVKSNISKSATDIIEIEPENEKTNILSNNSAISSLARAEDNVYKAMYPKCETCPDEVKEEKKFWDSIRQRENLREPSAKKLSGLERPNINMKPTELSLDKNNKQIVKGLDVIDHGDEIEINRVKKTEKDTTNITDYRKYGIENVQTMNSENHPSILETNRQPYNKRLDSQMLNTILKLRTVRQYRLSVPGAGQGPDLNYRLMTSIVEPPPKPRKPDGPHGAGASIGTLFYDYN